ncbi:hypothetical protein H2198_002504 [Neophaeococcomyces mojaviensis]|uniref:Uncharacterized protein n=1 Tax=Neophaeococcomyces mojaviensis TaxID=3383035 RepID=A0ACC3AEA4_9EURO|nr:hypothetical protein H2198_002504 [Knufia sp. JES_112]
MSASIEDVAGTKYQDATEIASAPLQPRNPVFTNALPFIIGGSSGIVATICVQPLDMIKVRMQLSDRGTRSTTGPLSVTVVKDLWSNGKVLGFYQGISAAISRQVVYGTSRLGLFVKFEDFLKRRAERTRSAYGFWQRALASVCAGGLGAAIGNPTEVALIRIQSDGLRPVSQRKNYRSVIDALTGISRQEGISALWSGSFPTIIRAMSTNFGQLAFFSESKHQLQTHTKLSDRARTLVASAIGGFCAAFFSMPFDFVKSRLQSQQEIPGGSRHYTGMLDCFVKVARDEGLSGFYRGFPAYFSRMAPHS